jgi:HEAT repeat protein
MTDIEAMKNAHDVKGLIRLLDHDKHNIQWRAADALGTLGEMACDPLLKLLVFPRENVRIGAIEALGDIKSPRSVEPLIQTLAKDKSNEVRWVAALALGEIGESRAIPALVRALNEEDRYVRFGSAKALEQIGWSAETDQELAYYYIALQEWNAVKKMGNAATVALIDMLKEDHPAIRTQIVEILGSIRSIEAKRACERVLRDPDADVRWLGVLLSKRCGMPTSHLPIGLSKRPQTGPNRFGATLLNFFFVGLGYDYLGKWWGLLVLEIYLMLVLLGQLRFGAFLTFVILFPIMALFATQTYYMAKRESVLSG